MTAFDALNTYYKSTTGALAAGETLRLRVCVPRAFGVTACTLVLYTDGAATDYRAMQWEWTDGHEEWWQIALELPAGLFFYHFAYETGWGRTVLHRYKDSARAGIDGTEDWQLTVYDPSFRTPDRFKGGIIYQIFPDRFYNSGQKKRRVPTDRVLHTDLTDLPVYLPDAEGKIRNNDYFGGDLAGITEKLDDIAALGADILYLNPICEAHSNHRYNTADYKKVDPLLGTDDDFRRLCEEAHARGMKVLLDGVYSHTGDDSVYFNKYARYASLGAYQSEDSPYYDWYSFGKTRDEYRCWWNIDTLPEINENVESFSSFITGEGGVIDHWMALGADGVRLDVADELPDGFLDKVRVAVKRHGEDKFVLGEVWEDASNKISHGGRRHYFDGRQLDGVMNYPFRTAILEYMLSGNAGRFMRQVHVIVLHYPKEALDVCMNMLGTHDTERVLTALTGVNLEGKNRQAQAALQISAQKQRHAKKLLRAAAAILYLLPGIPSVYYGDEAGMAGAKDPFNRAYFPWGNEDTALIHYFRSLGAIRRTHPVLRSGGFYPLSAESGTVAFLRYQPGEKRLALICNNNPEPIVYNLNTDMREMMPLIGGTKLDGAVQIPAHTAAILADL